MPTSCCPGAAMQQNNCNIPANTRVLVSGAGGYLASHCVQQLLDAGYVVRGTMRDPGNAGKTKPLTDMVGSVRLELVKADLNNEADWPRIVKGCTFILHVASPLVPNADETVIKTAVDGTLNVLKAANQCPDVKKVVLTSSCLAIIAGHSDKKSFDDTIWGNPDGPNVNNYSKSKILAEQAAWNFVKAIKDGNRFDFCTVLPAFITGPTLVNESGTSTLAISEMMKNTPQDKLSYPLPLQFPICVVDVRDAATAHVRALSCEGVNGQRIIMCSRYIWTVEMALELSKEFKEQGYTITFADQTIPPEHHGKEPKLDNSKAKKLLGIRFTDPGQSLADMGYSLIERGFVDKSAGYKA